MFNQEGLVKEHRGRGAAIRIFVICAFSIVLGRLWYLQVYKGDLLLNYSLQNKLRRIASKATRGVLYDRDNKILVDNAPRFDAVVTPQYLKNKKKTIKNISKILGMDEKKIYSLLKKNSTMPSYHPVVIKKNVSFTELSKIETENSSLPGVTIETTISREYVGESVGAHLLGHISEINQDQLPIYIRKYGKKYKIGDHVGQSGLEKSFDLYLRGEDGHEFVEVDARGRKRKNINTDNLFKGIKDRPALPGKNIILTIDQDLQQVAHNALEGKVGGLVLVEIKTGKILSYISRPSFDPSVFSRGLTKKYWDGIIKNVHRPLRDRVIQEHFSPGSIFKPLVILAALEEGIITKDTEVHCPGKIKIGKRVFHCWKKGGHGHVKAERSLKESCDIFYYKIAMKMDIDVLSRYASMFGMGKKSGIKLPGEVSGLVPTKKWKRDRFGVPWVMGDTISCVIGQSYTLSTLLQMAYLYAALANNGQLMAPKIIELIKGNDGNILKEYASRIVQNIPVSKKNLDIVMKGLFRSVNETGGTSWWFRGVGNALAGKTGTSQVVSLSSDRIYKKCELLPFEMRHHALFAAVSPYDDPKVAIAVVVEHGCHGSSAAVPVAATVISKYLEKYLPEKKKKFSKIDRSINAAYFRKLKEKKKEQEN